MNEFSIFNQIDQELEEFEREYLVLAKEPQSSTIRYLSKKDETGYQFNQAAIISFIDLYYNSRFENGSRDHNGKRKLFLNIGKFRTDVAAKQIDLDVKDFSFIPDDYSYPYMAFFMQKEFREWAKDSDFADLINTCVENFPKYGSIVMKEVKNEPLFVPLQTIANDQCAETLQSARYVIEKHMKMTAWDIKMMKGWNTEGLDMGYSDTIDVYERYGHVPADWLQRNGEYSGQDDYPDTVAIVGKHEGKKIEHVFFTRAVTKRPYRERHWNKQHGRWLGLGVMEDLFENQVSQNIITNLQRRGLEWASKKIFQATAVTPAAKNLSKDVQDGSVIEVGQQGQITQVDMVSRAGGEYNAFLQQWEQNANQKAFTYEVATGEALPSGTPFSLGVLLQNSANAYFSLKREKLGLFLKEVIEDFMIPEFLKDISNTDKMITMFSDEPGYEALKVAAMDYVTGEAIKASLQNGQAVDVSTIQSTLQPFTEIGVLYFDRPKQSYADVKYKFQLTVTGEEVDVPKKMETLKTIYQIFKQDGDPRAEKVLNRLAALSGENIAVFGIPNAKVQINQPTNAQPGIPEPVQSAPATV